MGGCGCWRRGLPRLPPSALSLVSSVYVRVDYRVEGELLVAVATQLLPRPTLPYGP